MNTLKKLKLLVIGISITIASIYLTFLVDTQTLNTWLKRIFIFLYFVVVSATSFYYYNKTKTKRLTLIPVLCAIALVFLFQNTFLPTKEEHTIYIQSVKASDSAAEQSKENPEKELKEVWFVDLEVDGQKKPLSNITINDNRQWVYAGDYDDYIFRPSYDDDNEPNDNILSFTVVGNDIKLSFIANTHAGSVSIYYYEYDEKTLAYAETISLYNEDMTKEVLEKTLNIAKEYSIFETVLYNVGAVVVLTFALKVLLLAIMHFINKKKERKTSI